MTAPAIQDGAGAGVGYTFADVVTAEQKSEVCRLLARWGRRSGDERERAESSASVKAPGGEVVYFSGVVPVVHSSKTEHLWVSANVPPPPAAAPPRRGAPGVGVSRREPELNPWRGKAVDADIFQHINSDDKNFSSQIRSHQEVGGTRGGAEGGGGAKYMVGVDVDDSTPRTRRGKSSASEEKEEEPTNRDFRIASEPGAVPSRTKTFRKHTAGGKGKLRRRGSTDRQRRNLSDQSDASAGQGDGCADRSRVQSEPAQSASRGALDVPRNQHRKLRPIAMEAQDQGTSEKPAALGAGDGAAEGTPAPILTPLAPSKSKSSKVMKTYW